jgi:hypothetical protein
VRFCHAAATSLVRVKLCKERAGNHVRGMRWYSRVFYVEERNSDQAKGASAQIKGSLQAVLPSVDRLSFCFHFVRINVAPRSYETRFL